MGYAPCAAMNPYAPPSAPPPPGPRPVALHLAQASLGRRLGGGLIDIAVVVVVGSVLANAFCRITGTTKTVRLIQVFLLAVRCVPWGLATVRRQTIGKILLAMRIVVADDNLPGFVRGVALRALPFTGLAIVAALVHPMLGTLMSLVGTADLLAVLGNKRCLHDYPGTFVVHEQ